MYHHREGWSPPEHERGARKSGARMGGGLREHGMRSNPCIIIERDGARPNMSGELGRAEREWAEDCGSMECGAIRVSS